MLVILSEKIKSVILQFFSVVVMTTAILSCASVSRSSKGAWTLAGEAQMKKENADRQRLYDELYAAAVGKRLSEHYDEAYVLMQQALAVCPDAPEAVFEMAMLILHYGSEEGPVYLSEGDSLLKRAAELAPENKEYLRTYAMSLAEKEKYAEAVAIFEKLVAEKATEDLLSQLLNLYRAAGQDDKALQVLDRLEKLEGADNNISFERYRIYIARKDTARAFAAIDQLLAANPGDMYFVALKANLYHEQGYNDKALALFRYALEKDPKQAYARVSLLSFYKTLREEQLYQQLFGEIVYDPETPAEIRDNIMRQFYVDAMRDKADTASVMPVVRKVMSLPQESRTLGEMTLGYLTEIRYPRDSMAFVHERVLEAEPDFNLSRLELIFTYVQQEKRERVHELCSEGRKYAAGQAAYYIYDALALNEMERSDEAIRVLCRGEEMVDSTTDSGIRSQMVAFLGDLYHEAGEKEKAYAAFDKAVAYDPENIGCLNNYAYFLSKDGQHLDKAESMSKLTIEAEPQNPTYLDTYAWILYIQENYTQARIYIDETLKYAGEKKENATLYEHAGDIYYHCGERGKALDFWKTALRLTDDAALQKSLQKKIRRGRP